MNKVLIVLMFILLGTSLIVVSNMNKGVENSFVVEYQNNKNLALPDLTTATELGDGEYQLKNDYELILNYNIYTGIYTINGASNGSYGNQLFTIYENLTVPPYTISLYSLSGNVIPNGSYPRFRFNTNTSYPDFRIAQFNSSYSTMNYEESITGLYIHTTKNGGFDNYQFKLQIEQGDTATSYVVPNLIPIYKDNLTQQEKNEIGIGAFGGISKIIKTISDIIKPVGDFVNGLLSIF